MINAKNVSFRNVDLLDGFWLNRYNLNKNVSVGSVRKRFEDSGRMDALRFNYIKNGKKPHVYYDSDVAKWIEGVAYLIEKDRAAMSEHEKLVDELVDCMAAAQRDNGYLNSTFQQCQPDKIYTDRNLHELYCAGHLMEAAVAYDEATGKHKFLNVMEKYAEHIYKVFVVDKSAAFTTPGHEEIELALFKMYKHTGKKMYRELAEFFLKNRGVADEKTIYGDNKRGSQDNVDIYHLSEAVGHSVRALYLYSGIVDMAEANGDETLLANVMSAFEDIITRKMYITGGMGSTYRGEGFTNAYDLPNDTAYSESCCAIAALMLTKRLRAVRRDARFGHFAERVMYNSLLSSTSLDGKSFFYENPLEIRLEDIDRENAIPKHERERLPINQRVEVFYCSCCPPNINRIFGEFGDHIAVEDETLFIEQYVSAKLNTSFGTVTVSEKYATEGKATISSADYTLDNLAIRVPEWCTQLTATLDGKSVKPTVHDGYAYFAVGKKFTLELNFNIKPQFVQANPMVSADCGKVALTYGPVVYCIEGADNGCRLSRVSVDAQNPDFKVYFDQFHSLMSIDANGYVLPEMSALYAPLSAELDAKRLKFIPYYAFANRGASDMQVWVRRK